MRSLYQILIITLLINYNAIAQSIQKQNTKVSTFASITESFPNVTEGDIDWGDYNQDGLMDFVMCGNDGSTLHSIVYRNDGSSTFTDISAGLTPIRQGITRWVDFNNDGYLDIFISGNSSHSDVSLVTKLYINNSGDGTFTPLSFSFSALYVCDAVWADFNNDGWQDLVIAGDNGGSAKTEYYVNNGNATFTLQTAPFASVQNADIDVLDYNQDGHKDLILTGSIGGVSSNPGTFLYSNNGDGTFSYISTAQFAGVTYGDVKCTDFNSDGLTDIFLLGSHLSSQRIAKLYKNNGDSTFTETGSFEGIIRGYIALADWDNDGDIDIHYNGANITIKESYFYTNEGDFSFSLNKGLVEPLTFSAGNWADLNNLGKQELLILGNDAASANQTYLYDSEGGANGWPENQKPYAPHHLIVEQDGCGQAILKWEAGVDSLGTEKLNDTIFTYNVYIGASAGNTDIVNPLANLNSGVRLVNKPGNALNNKSFIIKGLQPGTYYWSVQTIDAGNTGSNFAMEESFTVSSNSLNIISQPVAPSVCIDVDTAVSVEVEGTVISYLWQYSKDEGTTWRDTSANQARFSLDHLTMENNLWRFRCKIESPCQTIYSDDVELIVHPFPTKPVITQSGLTLTVNNEPEYDSYQWYGESGAIAGETSNTYTPTADGKYSVEVTSVYGCSNISDGYEFDFQSEPIITTQAPDIVVCENTDTALHIETSGDVLGYQWQISTNIASGFNNITGANSHRLELNQQGLANSGNMYRCIITNDYYEKISDTVEVIVQQNPEPVITVAEFVLTCTNATTYQWYKDNNMINDATNQSYTVTEDGEYWVVVTNEYGCEGSSNRIIIVIESVENELANASKIYPNPAKDILKIDSDITLDKVEIYNAIGQLFYSAKTEAKNISLNISQYEKGIYLVKLVAGNKSHTYRLIIE